ncbi:MAG: response regulator, partial [Bdellovibrionales bacterium]|nr:response regulator [Bdellovibrionales bacterium]
DYDTRTVVKTILVGSGYTVEEASGGQEALDTLERYHPDLIVLDIMMPGMSGYDVVVHLKQKPATQNIPIIMLTAKSEPEDLITGYKDYAVDYYITKPFTTRQLIAGVQLILADDDPTTES